VLAGFAASLHLLVTGLVVSPVHQERATESVREVLEQLVERTNGIGAFVAEYLVHSPTQETDQRLTLAYQAPARALIRIRGDEEVFTCRFQDGTIDLRMTPPDGKSAFAHVSASQLNARSSDLAAAIRSGLSAISKEWVESYDVLPKFDLQMGPGTSSEAKSISFRLGYESERGALFGWLKSLEKQGSGQQETADRLAFVSDGTRLVLSTKTGFVERIERPKEAGLGFLNLETLDVEPSFEESDFDIRPSSPGAEDLSKKFLFEMRGHLTTARRTQVFRRVQSAIDDQTLVWGHETQGGLNNVLVIVHSDELAVRLDDWIVHCRKNIDEFSDWLANALRAPGGTEGASRDELKRAVEERKQLMKTKFDAATEKYRSAFEIPSSAVRDTALRDEFQEIEAAAVGEAFTRVVTDPLNAYFDEKTEIQLR